MTRRTKWVRAYAIVRRDHFPGDEHDPDSNSPPLICGGEYSYAVKEVVLGAEVADREVERLNSQQGSSTTRYFVEGTHLFTDGGSFGEESEE